MTESVDKSRGEILLMALKYSLKNKLPLIATSTLLQLLNNLFNQPILLESRYMIDKIFNPKTNSVFHAICPTCKIYVGKLEDLQPSVICKNCNECLEVSTPSCQNLFVTINPYDAIEDLLNEHFDYYEDVLKKRSN